MNDKKVYYFPDSFINGNLAASAGATIVETSYVKRNIEDFKNSVFLVRGITKNKYCLALKSVGADYFYIDTGYFGNFNTYYGVGEIRKKFFHRAAFNQMQMHDLVKRNNSRYLKTLEYIKLDFGLREDDFLKPWKTSGNKIMLCPPSEKVAAVTGIDVSKWISNVSEEIKKYSDREIIIRTKPKSRSERVGTNTIQDALDQDIYMVVTYNSIAATESIIHGVPALTLGPNAASKVSLNKIKNINNPIYPNRQLWLNNLAYGQFHITEYRDGTAWKYLKEYINQNE